MPPAISRRLILVGTGVSLAALACGDSDDDTSSGDGGASASSTSANTGTGGNSAGGSNAGGNNAGGSPGVGGGGPSVGGGGPGVCGGALLIRGSNYNSDPHDITIPLADFEAGQTKTYKSTGMGHDHDITVTAADFDALRNGETVKKYICLQNPDFTDHEFVISCADPNIMPTFEGEIGTPNNCPG